MIIWSASTVGAAWVLSRRRRYRRSGHPLSEDQLHALAPWFGRPLLESVRIARVERIENPLVYSLLPLIGGRAPMDLGMVSGMAFADTIVLSSPKRGINQESLLFHELVHVAQYELLGVHPFVLEYLRGWLNAGRDYFSIPLEQQAFALQDRFATAGEPFHVPDLLQQMLKGEPPG